MTPRAEHVWVTDVQVWGDRQAPGLLLGWERRNDGWYGHVIVVQTAGQNAGPYVTQVWTHADRIARFDE